LTPPFPGWWRGELRLNRNGGADQAYRLLANRYFSQINMPVNINLKMI
jgi:hypothetical protein